MIPVLQPEVSSPKSSCMECHAPLPPLSLAGLCPKCLLKLGLHETSAPESVGMAASRPLVPPPHFPFDFGDYRIWRLLGRGGMGAVYEADQRSTGRRVALKVLGHSFGIPEARGRFLREGALAATINHPNSVYVFGTEEIEGTPVIVMELVRGRTLKDALRDGALEPSKAVDAVLQVIAGLEAAAKQGVLHRDIKPANCFQSTEGQVKVGDYGLSISSLARGETALTQTGISMGTPGFTSPEQLRGEDVEVRSDIYSVGATLYALLTGHAPFEADNGVQVVAKVLDHAFTPIRKRVPSLPHGLAQIVEGCLSMRPEMRFPDYESLRNALQPYASSPLEAAPLRLRLAASLVDALFVLILWQAVSMSLLVLSGSPRHGNALGALPVLMVGFYAAIDGFSGGRTVGRMLLGLRLVLGASPMALVSERLPRMARLRSLLLHLFVATSSRWRTYATALLRSLLLFGLLFAYLRSPLPPLLRTQSGLGAWASQLLAGLTAVLPFCTARKRNGYAGWHDLLTQTRVVRLPSPNSIQQAPSPEPLASEPNLDASQESIGPFRPICSPTSLPPSWKEAFDDTLKRRVWVRLCEEQTPPVSEQRRAICRTTRLRWIAGKRSSSKSWDAYEAPSGLPLDALPPRPWSVVRAWLLDLVQEARIAAAEDTLPSAIGLENIRIGRNGALLLLDETPGSEPAQRWDLHTLPGLQRFLSALCDQVLERETLPVHARDFLARLRDQRFEEALVLEGNLLSLSTRLTEVPRRLRISTFLLIAFGVVSWAAIDSAPQVRQAVTLWTQRMDTYGEYAPLAKAACVTRLLSLRSAWGAPPGGQIHGFHWIFNRNAYFGIPHADLKTWIRGNYGPFLQSPALESDPRFASWTSPEKDALRNLAQTPEPAPETLHQLNEYLLPVLKADLFPQLMGIEFLAAQLAIGLTALRALIGMACLSLLTLAYLVGFGNSPILHLTGMALLERDGARAGRSKLTVRWLLQQSYLILMFGSGYWFKILNLPHIQFGDAFVDVAQVVPGLRFYFPGFYLPWGTWGFVLLTLPLMGIAASAWWGTHRGLADLLCGTRLVRR
ncbi:MAG: hypothetical protein RLZZ142_576 [Verrucomicrobiota bacterium]